MNIIFQNDLGMLTLNDNGLLGVHNIVLNEVISSPGDFMEMTGEPGSRKDPLLSSWFFVIGISTISLAISIGVGILLAKRKIKKGYGLYED